MELQRKRQRKTDIHREIEKKRELMVVIIKNVNP